ncbi:MAG: ATPase P, partial [Syntrophomonadaceae bacterium]|nr:ATPase P [Syntrophomonadaceae bacterium]
MNKVIIPGRGEFVFKYLLLDMNGTVSTDGVLIPGVKWRLKKLKEFLDIYLITADTFGSALDVSADLGIELAIISPIDGGQDKLDFLKLKGSNETIAIGNGFNDVGLLREAGLSIVVMGSEGCSVQALNVAMIAVSDIRDALDLILC